MTEFASALCNFQGKTVIIAESSTRIGRETARIFAEKGAKIVITSKDAASLTETKNLCIEAGADQENVLEILANFDSDESLSAIIDDTVKAFGGIDILVINVCIERPDSQEHADTAVDRGNREILRSILALTNFALPHLAKTKGSVVNVASLAAHSSGEQEICYAISKSALDQLIIQTATRLIKMGVRVNSVNQGLIEAGLVCKINAPKNFGKALFHLGENTWMVHFGKVGEGNDIAE
ncbi:hypothetical protein PRIPAC_97656, partial [Pristionchus pacificus]|uniref:Dehydrogenase n=1 Tax=Pristionchus pacificus TaxID=54126 RepID=A0A2A6D2M8_PRIPA